MSETTSPPGAELEPAVTAERRGHVLLMGLNRPAKRNAFNLAMIDQLAAAYHRLESDEDVRCGHGHDRGNPGAQGGPARHPAAKSSTQWHGMLWRFTPREHEIRLAFRTRRG